MKLSDLLDYTAKEFLDDRTDILDGDPDEIWSDTTIVRYLNEAQNRLCRRSWVLVDLGHATAGVIVLKTGVTTYPIHKSVLRIMSATPEDTQIPLGRSTDSRLQFSVADDPDFFDVNLPYTQTPGRPVAFATDAATRLLRVDRAPSATENGLRLLLKTVRLPSCALSLEDTDAEPEVAEEYHLWLPMYAAGRCLTHPNVDSSAKREGRQFLADFEALVKEARQDRTRAEMAPPKFVYASSTALLG